MSKTNGVNGHENGNGHVNCSVNVSEYPPNLQNRPEITEEVNGVVTGKIPSWLKGSILGCGPGMYHFKEGSVKHLMDGMAMLHKVNIDGEKSTVCMTQKYLKSSCYEKSIEAGKPSTVLIGSPFKVQPLRPFGPYEFTDNCLGILHEENPGEVFLQSDHSTYFFTIDPETLEPKEKNHYLKSFKLYSMRPMPLEDDNGDLYNCGGTITGSLQCQILRMKKENREKPLNERWEILCQIPSRLKTSGSILRCLGITKNYVIFIEQPAVVNAMKMTATYIKQYSMMDWLEWHPDLCNRFHIVNKETGEELKTEFISFAAFYGVAILNAYEDDDNNVVIDCIALPNTDIMKALLLENLISPDESMANIYSGSVVRYVMPLIDNLDDDVEEGDNYIEAFYEEAQAIKKSDKVVVIPEVKSLGVDYGVVNPKYIGKPYKYAYGISTYARKGAEIDGSTVVKVELNHFRSIPWQGKEGQVPSYPVFIPNPNPREVDTEDDGVLVFGLTESKISNDEGDVSQIVILDATSMEVLATVSFKEKIPVWIHGIWRPSIQS